MIENCVKCDTTMPDERVHLGYRECVDCSSVEAYSAHIVYPHKTGAFIQPVFFNMFASTLRSESRFDCKVEAS